MRRALAIALLVAPTAFADRVVLKGGGVLTGVIVERNAKGVVLEVGPGRVGLPASRIERIENGDTALGAFRARAAALDPGDAAGWAALGSWARGQGLETQARAAFERALEADPRNAEAHRGLSHVLRGDLWLTPEESYRAQGLVPFEGRWVSPGERDAIVQERLADAALAQSRREADARVREAEARAREAEAAASRAATAAAAEPVGIPYWWAALAGNGCSHPNCGRPPHGHRPPQPPKPPAAKPPPPRDMGDRQARTEPR